MIRQPSVGGPVVVSGSASARGTGKSTFEWQYAVVMHHQDREHDHGQAQGAYNLEVDADAAVPGVGHQEVVLRDAMEASSAACVEVRVLVTSVEVQLVGAEEDAAACPRAAHRVVAPPAVVGRVLASSQRAAPSLEMDDLSRYVDDASTVLACARQRPQPIPRMGPPHVQLTSSRRCTQAFGRSGVRSSLGHAVQATMPTCAQAWIPHA